VLDRDAIVARIPHQGAMCLLDAVVEWTPASISCRATSHRDPANPLRAEGRLGAASAIEYAAQAMAVHGALLAGSAGKPRFGYLASLRAVTLHVTRLDDLAGELRIDAERVSGDENRVLYQFAISHQRRCLVDGRAAVVLDAETLTGERWT